MRGKSEVEASIGFRNRDQFQLCSARFRPIYKKTRVPPSLKLLFYFAWLASSQTEIPDSAMPHPYEKEKLPFYYPDSISVFVFPSRMFSSENF